MLKSQFGEAYQELIDGGWTWQGKRFVSPSGAHIDNPSAEDILKLRAAMNRGTGHSGALKLKGL
jgi:hypothetical protein